MLKKLILLGTILSLIFFITFFTFAEEQNFNDVDIDAVNFALTSSPAVNHDVYPKSPITYFIEYEMIGFPEIDLEDFDFSNDFLNPSDNDNDEENFERITANLKLEYTILDSAMECYSNNPQENIVNRDGLYIFNVECRIKDIERPEFNRQVISPVFKLMLNDQELLDFNKVHAGFQIPPYKKDTNAEMLIMSVVQNPARLLNGVSRKNPDGTEIIRKRSTVDSNDSLDKTQSIVSISVPAANSENNIYPYFHGKKITELSGQQTVSKTNDGYDKSYHKKFIICDYNSGQFSNCYERYYRASPSGDFEICTRVMHSYSDHNNYYDCEVIDNHDGYAFKDNREYSFFIEDGQYEIMHTLVKTSPYNSYVKLSARYIDGKVSVDGQEFSSIEMNFYNPANDLSRVDSLSMLDSQPVFAQLNISLPDTYPYLEFNSAKCGIGQDIHAGYKRESVLYDCSSADKTRYSQVIELKNFDTSVDANSYLRDGAQQIIRNTDLESYAKNIGKSGIVFADINAKILKTAWKYEEVSKKVVIWEYSELNDDRLGLDRNRDIPYYVPDGGENYGYSYDFYIEMPKYAWTRTSFENTQKELVMEEVLDIRSYDQAQVDVFSSAAWIKTEGGHLGTNKEIKSEGGADNMLKFRNYVGDDEIQETEFTKPKDFAPENQDNAEFMVYAPSTLNEDTGKSEFSSAARWYHTIDSESKDKYGYNQKGEEFDNGVDCSSVSVSDLDKYEQGCKYDYRSELIEKQSYGEVIDLVEECKDYVSDNAQIWGTEAARDLCNTYLKQYRGLSVDLYDPVGGIRLELNNRFVIRKGFNLPKGKIYYIPSDYFLDLGHADEDLILDGSSARLEVDSDVNIEGNIFYASSKAANYLDIPNLRLSGKEIRVSPEVEYIEMQITADKFYTGQSHEQLKILGDVIAGETYFQRSPTNVLSADELESNPPSELIIEDLRKYIIPSPGDTILRDREEVWQQVNPSTGKLVDPY